MLSSGGSDWKTIHVKRIDQETGETTGERGGGRSPGLGQPLQGWAAPTCNLLMRRRLQAACSCCGASPSRADCPLTPLHPDLEDKLDHVKFSVRWPLSGGVGCCRGGLLKRLWRVCLPWGYPS